MFTPLNYSMSVSVVTLLMSLHKENEKRKQAECGGAVPPGRHYLPVPLGGARPYCRSAPLDLPER